MYLTKLGHACVRLETETGTDRRVLVVDPGIFSDAAALDGAHAVLVTHEHPDHINVARVLAACREDPGPRVYAPPSVLDAWPELGRELNRERLVAVRSGETFDAAGFGVEVVGGEHAEIYDGLPGCANVGYIVDATVYHPGDSLFVPTATVSTLLVPAAAPWLKLAEAIDFVRAVKPQRAFPIHDATLNELGQEYFDGWMDEKGLTAYARASDGERYAL